MRRSCGDSSWHWCSDQHLYWDHRTLHLCWSRSRSSDIVFHLSRFPAQFELSKMCFCVVFVSNLEYFIDPSRGVLCLRFDWCWLRFGIICWLRLTTSLFPNNYLIDVIDQEYQKLVSILKNSTKIKTVMIKSWFDSPVAYNYQIQFSPSWAVLWISWEQSYQLSSSELRCWNWYKLD